MHSVPEESARTVILVDDDPAVRKALTRQITGFGHTVEAFGSAREFLDQAEQIQGDCLIVDLVMPEIDGLALLDALGRIGHAIPTFLLSGQGDIPSTVRAMRGGALDFLEKPVDVRSAARAPVREA
jgi:FixJ family two-component response regulator